ncbi:MAG: hypothetical protein ACRD3T_22265 [Terriglobia bacterium]
MAKSAADGSHGAVSAPWAVALGSRLASAADGSHGTVSAPWAVALGSRLASASMLVVATPDPLTSLAGSWV